MMNIQKSLLTVTEYIHFFKKRQEEESFLVCLIRLYFGSPLSFLAMRLYEDEEEYGSKRKKLKRTKSTTVESAPKQKVVWKWPWYAGKEKENLRYTWPSKLSACRRSFRTRHELKERISTQKALLYEFMKQSETHMEVASRDVRCIDSYSLPRRACCMCFWKVCYRIPFCAMM